MIALAITALFTAAFLAATIVLTDSAIRWRNDYRALVRRMEIQNG